MGADGKVSDGIGAGAVGLGSGKRVQGSGQAGRHSRGQAGGHGDGCTQSDNINSRSQGLWGVVRVGVRSQQPRSVGAHKGVRVGPCPAVLVCGSNCSRPGAGPWGRAAPCSPFVPSGCSQGWAPAGCSGQCQAPTTGFVAQPRMGVETPEPPVPPDGFQRRADPGRPFGFRGQPGGGHVHP